MQNNLQPKTLSKRAENLRAELLRLLGGATTHPEIEKALPNCEAFFKKMTGDDFVELIDSSDGYEPGKGFDPVYTALWYHCGRTMNFAVRQCALFGARRMKMLYPLWREFTDEAEGYGRPGRKRERFSPNFALLGREISRVLENPTTPEKLRNALMYFLNELFNNSPNQRSIDSEDDLSPDYVEQVFRSYFLDLSSAGAKVRPFKAKEQQPESGEVQVMKKAA